MLIFVLEATSSAVFLWAAGLDLILYSESPFHQKIEKAMMLPSAQGLLRSPVAYHRVPESLHLLVVH